MDFKTASQTVLEQLLADIKERYGLQDRETRPVAGHDGGRNIVLICQGDPALMLRVTYLPDRRYEDVLAEAEFVRWLAEGGASVCDVIASRAGRLVETLQWEGHTFFVCAFQKAPGRLLAEYGYRYRNGAPLEEYFFNCGKTLGAMHRLSKAYKPAHPRYDFFDHFSAETFEKLLPDSLAPLREKFLELLQKLSALKKNEANYGTVHFDYCDGNYCVDNETGKITVFDFDNACRFWYLYDLADVWNSGVGWIQFEPDADKRRAFMDAYFATVIKGYRTETDIDDAQLELVPLFINVTMMEGVIDEYETALVSGEEPELDEHLEYKIACMLKGLPYDGFFSDIYNSAHPFVLT